MHRNRGKPWTSEQLHLLVAMIHEKAPLKHVCGVLGRSENAIRHAIQKILYQQLLDYDPRELVEYYHTQIGVLQNDVVPEKYFVGLPDTYEEESQSSTNEESFSEIFQKSLITGLLLLFGAGCYRYLQVLNSNWDHV